MRLNIFTLYGLRVILMGKYGHRCMQNMIAVLPNFELLPPSDDPTAMRLNSSTYSPCGALGSMPIPEFGATIFIKL